MSSSDPVRQCFFNSGIGVSTGFILQRYQIVKKSKLSAEMIQYYSYWSQMIKLRRHTQIPQTHIKKHA